VRGDKNVDYNVSVGQPEGKRLLRRSRRRWQNGIRMHLREMAGRCGVDSGGSGQGPVVSSCEHDDEPSGSGATDLLVR
jgi:hypothetical protein